MTTHISTVIARILREI